MHGDYATVEDMEPRREAHSDSLANRARTGRGGPGSPPVPPNRHAPGRVYRSKAWYEAEPNRIDWTNIGLVSALLAVLFSVPVILLLGALGVISW